MRRLPNLAAALLVSGLALTLAGVVLAQSMNAPLPDSTPPPDSRIAPTNRHIDGWAPSTQPAAGIASTDAQGTLTITTEGFEGAFPTGLWTLLPPNPNHWGTSTCQKRTGSKSAWVEGTSGLSCGSNYHLSEQAWMIYGPFSLTDALSAQLKFSYWISSEQAFDTLFWGSAVTSTFSGFETSGNSNGWINQTFDLGNRVGQSSVWIAFVWDSDFSITFREGAFVDDVVLTKSLSIPNLVGQKAADRSMAEAGETLTYTLSVLNNGAGNAPAARLTDTLPISMSLIGGSLTANTGRFGASGQVITWAGVIHVGQTVRITYSVALTNYIPNVTTLINPVTIDDGFGRLSNIQASLTARGSLTHLPLIVRNYSSCTPPPISDPGFASQPDMLQINADDAWSQCVLGSPGIAVAIIDSGADLDHPDLVANLIPGYDYVDDDAVPEDGQGHGSHVAGIAGSAINGVGVVGVAPNTHLLPVRVLDNSGFGSVFAIADGITYAANNAQILNLSLGTVNDGSTLRDAINYAANIKGRLVIASAGNCGDSNYAANGCSYQDQPSYPGAYANVMAVAAVTVSDTQASFSTQGAYVDIAAPGVSIYNTHKNGGYASISGTSQAAPHVAGLAALIWARFPIYTAAQVRSAIESTAVDLGAPGTDIQFGAGRIDVTPAVGLGSVAVAAAPVAPAPVDLPPPDQRDADFVPGRVLIKFKPEVSAAGIDRALSAFSEVSIEDRIDELGVHRLRVPAGLEWQLIDQLRALPGVLYAEPDTIIRLYPEPDSP